MARSRALRALGRRFCFLERGFEEALKSYDQAAALDPKMPEAFAGRGAVRMAMALERSGEPQLRQQAIEDWHRSLELKPDQPKIRRLVEKYQPAQQVYNTILDTP